MPRVFAFAVIFATGDFALAADELSAKSQAEIRIDGRTLAYTVEAGRLPIRDMESGEVRGRMFYVAYRIPATRAEKRPVMFSWGGGPSGPALRAHMQYGPRQVSDDGRIVDNPNTLLTVTDLVFVDPIGTGFSRPEKPAYVDEFYNTIGDGRAMAEFVRVWNALYNDTEQPVYLNGQSYGVWRAGIVAEMLEISGKRLAGIVITSGGTSMADEFTDRAFEIAYRTPDYAAAAFHHGLLSADRGETLDEVRESAEIWSRERYGPALARVDELSRNERERIATELSGFTGYPLDKIDRKTLVFSVPQYRSDVFASDGKVLNLFDLRTFRGEGGGNPATAAAQANYLRNEIGYRTDLAYIGLETGYTATTAPDYTSIGMRWVYNSGIGEAGREAAIAAGQGPPGKEPWVRRAIDINPDLRVFVAAGVYDSLNFCAANEDRVGRMPPELADNFQTRCYLSGHSIYFDPDAWPLLTKDIRDFIGSRRD